MPLQSGCRNPLPLAAGANV
ncbi:hypothetical protein BJG94_16235 [Rhizobium sp. Td3]|nr:hypothetical protein BJG94_16235 [Rhizobium sp. Td3]